LKAIIAVSLITVSILHQIACSPRYGIERYTKPTERPDVEVMNEGTALIRSIYCDIYVQQITPKNWEKLLKSTAFINPKSNNLKYRVPKLLFFQAIIKNTWKEPIKIDKIELKYDGITVQSLDAGELSSMHKSPMYVIFKFNKILSPRRIISEHYTVDKIDYEKDIISSRIKFIPPLDSELRIIAFGWIPIEYRKYKLIFTIYYPGNKKIIDFDFNRLEYRTDGGHFQKPKNKIENEDDEY